MEKFQSLKNNFTKKLKKLEKIMGFLNLFYILCEVIFETCSQYLSQTFLKVSKITSTEFFFDFLRILRNFSTYFGL